MRENSQTRSRAGGQAFRCVTAKLHGVVRKLTPCHKTAARTARVWCTCTSHDVDGACFGRASSAEATPSQRAHDVRTRTSRRVPPESGANPDLHLVSRNRCQIKGHTSLMETKRLHLKLLDDRGSLLTSIRVNLKSTPRKPLALTLRSRPCHVSSLTAPASTHLVGQFGGREEVHALGSRAIYRRQKRWCSSTKCFT